MIGLGPEHIEEGVVKGAQIGIDLILKITGQKAQLLSSLDGRAGQDYPVDLLFAEGRNGAGDGQIGLTRACRADAYGDDIVLYGIDIGLLSQGLCLHRLAAHCDTYDPLAHLGYLILTPVAHQRYYIIDVLGRDILSAGCKTKKGVDCLPGLHDIFGLAGYLELGIAVYYAYAILLFKQLYIFVERAEEVYHLFDAFDIGDLFNHLSFSCLFGR